MLGTRSKGKGLRHACKLLYILDVTAAGVRTKKLNTTSLKRMFKKNAQHLGDQ